MSAERRQSSSALPLAWLYAALIVYASLYPFSGWRTPGVSPLAYLEGLPRFGVTRFDIVSNLIAYLPFGLLVFVAASRSGGRAPAAAAGLAVAVGAGLSLTMETVQNYLPVRVPSLLDLIMNTAGSVLGAGVGWAVHSAGGLGHWRGFRERWFVPRSGGGIALLLLWPLALLFPAPLPLGLGQGLNELGILIAEALQGSAAQEWAEEWLEHTGPLEPLSRISEVAAVACGLLAPCAVANAIAATRWRRWMLLLGALILGFVATTLSTVLNFGPQHALAWLTPAALVGVTAGVIVAAVLASVPQRVAAGFGLVAICALIALVAQAPNDPYHAQSLLAWEQGRFIRFHGAAQWIGWLWPYAALAYLLVRLGSRRGDEGPPPRIQP